MYYQHLRIRTLFSKLLQPISLVLLVASLLPISTSLADETTEVSAELTTLFRSARAVISANQGLINEQGSGKVLTSDYVVEHARENFSNATGADLDLSNDPMAAKSMMLEAVTEVMNNAQDLINDPDVGFKGFLPAIFARQVATAFSRRMEGKMVIKLTAPKKYVRNRANRPDAWEANVIDAMFSQPGYETGKAFFEQTAVKGRDAYRYLLPEYYGQSCLSCHGGPKGELDITGGKKEGGVLGELGGAISLIIYQ